MFANVMPADPTPDPGVNRPKVIFSEHGLVAYQIKGITKWNNLVANILHHDAPPPTTLGDAIKGSKLNFFIGMVMMLIKLKGITNAATG